MRRFLLDTHAALWALAEPEKLSRPARMALEDAENEVFVSVVSGWEIAIKRALWGSWKRRTIWKPRSECKVSSLFS